MARGETRTATGCLNQKRDTNRKPKESIKYIGFFLDIQFGKSANVFAFSLSPSPQNFSVCVRCGRLAQLYHRLHHQKHRMFNMCSEVVEQRRKAMGGGQETTNILNELLANDSWLEQVREGGNLALDYLQQGLKLL